MARHTGLNTLFHLIPLFWFMGHTHWSHITAKSFTDAIKHADTQLHAFNVPKAEFPWHRCKHLLGQVNWKASLASPAGSRDFIDENVGDGRVNWTAVVWHDDLLFPTPTLLGVSTFQQMTTKGGKLKSICCLTADLLRSLFFVKPHSLVRTCLWQEPPPPLELLRQFPEPPFSRSHPSPLQRYLI